MDAGDSARAGAGVPSSGVCELFFVKTETNYKMRGSYFVYGVVLKLLNLDPRNFASRFAE